MLYIFISQNNGFDAYGDHKCHDSGAYCWRGMVSKIYTSIHILMIYQLQVYQILEVNLGSSTVLILVNAGNIGFISLQIVLTYWKLSCQTQYHKCLLKILFSDKTPLMNKIDTIILKNYSLKTWNWNIKKQCAKYYFQ